MSTRQGIRGPRFVVSLCDTLVLGCHRAKGRDPRWRIFLVFAFTDQVTYVPLLPINPLEANISQLFGKEQYFNIPTASLRTLTIKPH